MIIKFSENYSQIVAVTKFGEGDPNHIFKIKNRLIISNNFCKDYCIYDIENL
jgi:hypothetical protein